MIIYLHKIKLSKDTIMPTDKKTQEIVDNIISATARSTHGHMKDSAARRQEIATECEDKDTMARQLHEHFTNVSHNGVSPLDITEVKKLIQQVCKDHPPHNVPDGRPASPSNVRVTVDHMPKGLER